MKKRIGIIFGGRSGEHEVSVESARNICAALDRERYEPVMIGIDKRGQWHIGTDEHPLLVAEGTGNCSLQVSPEAGAVVPRAAGSAGALTGNSQPGYAGAPTGTSPAGSAGALTGIAGSAGAFTGTTTPTCANQAPLVLADPDTGAPRGAVDVFFPIAHGTFGEDGCLQGLLRLLDVPFVGAGVLGSAVGMDKDAMKRLLRDAGLPGPRFQTFRASDRPNISFDILSHELGVPFFVKPCNLGSSVGVSKVHTVAEFDAAVDLAFQFDRKIIVEEGIVGREIECAVLGNENPVASIPGEVLVNADFYSYEAKYLDENGAVIEIPAKLDPETIQRVQRLAIATFEALDCAGLARVDFFVRPDGEVLVNEINTLPGFTRISMYPKMWEASGVPYAKLLDRLIELAQESHEQERALRRSFRD